jgi:hypothetical protein
MENHPSQKWKRNSSQGCFLNLYKLLQKKLFRSFVGGRGSHEKHTNLPACGINCLGVLSYCVFRLPIEKVSKKNEKKALHFLLQHFFDWPE